MNLVYIYPEVKMHLALTLFLSYSVNQNHFRTVIV